MTGKQYIELIREVGGENDIHQEIRALIERARMDPEAKEMEKYFSHQTVYCKDGYRLFVVTIHVYPRQGVNGIASVVSAIEIDTQDSDEFFQPGMETYEVAKQMESIINGA